MYKRSWLVKIKTTHLIKGDKHVYQMLENLLLVPLERIHCKEIDIINNYENAVKWILTIVRINKNHLFISYRKYIFFIVNHT